MPSQTFRHITQRPIVGRQQQQKMPHKACPAPFHHKRSKSKAPTNEQQTQLAAAMFGDTVSSRMRAPCRRTRLLRSAPAAIAHQQPKQEEVLSSQPVSRHAKMRQLKQHFVFVDVDSKAQQCSGLPASRHNDPATIASASATDRAT